MASLVLPTKYTIKKTTNQTKTLWGNIWGGISIYDGHELKSEKVI
jgi:hypothetical protein